MEALSALMLAVPVIATANHMSNEYIYLARLREINPDSLELAFDLNSQLAAQCEYTVPASELLMNRDYFSFLRAYNNLGGRNEFYDKALSRIRCDDPSQGFRQDLSQSVIKKGNHSMFRYFSAEKSQRLGLAVFFIFALILFFIQPLSPMINRWLELGLCNFCILVCGWFAEEHRTRIAKFFELALLGTGVCFLPYLIHLGSRPARDENLMVDITATILLFSVFIGLNMHLGNEARKLYRSLIQQNSGQ